MTKTPLQLLDEGEAYLVKVGGGYKLESTRSSMVEAWAREFAKEHGFKTEIESLNEWSVRIGEGFDLIWDGDDLTVYGNGSEEISANELVKAIKSAKKKIAEVRKRYATLRKNRAEISR